MQSAELGLTTITGVVYRRTGRLWLGRPQINLPVTVPLAKLIWNISPCVGQPVVKAGRVEIYARTRLDASFITDI